MRKVKSVQIIKKEFAVLLLALFSFYGFSQRKEIKSNDDYTVLNIAIEKYFIVKKFSDSLFFSSELYKANPLHKKIKLNVKRRKKRDTLYIKAIADKIIYNQFLRENARWKRSRYNKKYLTELNIIFSIDEVANYNKQLEDNCYLWDKSNINFKDRVFVNDEIQLTREEIKNLPYEKKNLELRKIYDLEKRLNLYTFSKPIYSIDKKYILIAYNSGGTNILNIYENLDTNWKLKFSLSNNYFISKIRY